MRPLIVAITGGSGSMYALRLLDVLLGQGREVHLVMSSAAAQVLREETGIEVDLKNFDVDRLLLRDPSGPLAAAFEHYWQRPAEETSHFAKADESRSGRVQYHFYQDFNAGCASGSFLTDGMVICPCSMGTLAGLAHGMSANLIHRAADVHLKERRKLIVVPRETPLSTIALGNMHTLSQAGATVLPAMPGYYHRPHSLGHLIDFIVSRICDQLGVPVGLTKRWSEE